jgi:NADPH:quinone reductase-like Zn-dependent oxidoreductase
MKTMQAMRIHTYGGPEVLKYEDAPLPKPGSGEVLVRVHAAGVNPVDWKIREGYFKGTMNHPLPLILGWDLSGVVEATGSGVEGLKKDDEVYSRPDIARDGAYAEYIVVQETEVALKPKSIDHVHAAAIPLAALTAWQSLFDSAGLSAGQKVLIHAAAGGVGSFAVQLAKWKGAYVIGTASNRNRAAEVHVAHIRAYARARARPRGNQSLIDRATGPWKARAWVEHGKERRALGGMRRYWKRRPR